MQGRNAYLTSIIVRNLQSSYTYYLLDASTRLPIELIAMITHNVLIRATIALCLDANKP